MKEDQKMDDLRLKNYINWKDRKHFVGNVKRYLKFAKQRLMKGYCDYDIWSLDYWFVRIMPRVLQEYHDQASEHIDEPDLMESVKKMIRLFEDAKNLKVIYVSEEELEKLSGTSCGESCGEDWVDFDKFEDLMEYEKAKEKAANEKLKEAVGIFVEKLPELWW